MRTPLVLLVVVAAACASPTVDTERPTGASGVATPRPTGSPGWMTDLAELRATTATVLPADLPPGFEGITVATGNGLPLVSFHSTNEPTVTICTGPPGRCRRAVSVAEELRPSGGATRPAVVLVEPGEGGTRPLSEAARAFWSSAELTTASPAWLAAP